MKDKFRVVTVVYLDNGRLLGSHMSSITYDTRPTRRTIKDHEGEVKSFFSYPARLRFQSFPVLEGFYIHVPF